jgi:uncharacterized protein YndB with AHSA1/START domain
MSEDQSRKIDVSIEIAAQDEALWRAVSTAEELTRWFPPYARVTDPGVGGKIWLSWGEGIEGEGTIEAWEPNRLLRVSEPSGMVVEYIITKSGSGAVMRIVQSGFGTGETWDEIYDGVEGGWTYFLYSLKHYLERHPGKSRHLISARRKMSITRAEAWPLLLSTTGFALNAADWNVGERFTGRVGERAVSGDIVVYRPAQSFAGTLRELNDGLLFVELEAGAPWHCGAWLSLYGDDTDVAALQNTLNRVLDQVVSQSEVHHAVQ